MDVKTAVLHDELREEIYMEVPDDVQAPPEMVCRLQKLLYGLKWSPRCWNENFNDVLLKLEFVHRSMIIACTLGAARTAILFSKCYTSTTL